MIVYTKFDEFADLSELVISNVVDLDKAIETGTIESTSENLDYNGIEDPECIIGRCEDTFDAINAMNSLKAKAAAAQAAKSSDSKTDKSD